MTTLEAPNNEIAGKRTAPWIRFGGPLLVVIFALYMLEMTWRRWPDVLVDFGVQLYTAWQLSEGKLLYRDIAHVYGPLSPYLNALAFRFLGESFMSIVALNLLILTTILWLTYRLLLKVAGYLAATAGCLVFVGIFAFGQYMPAGNYNFVTPYVAETTHGLLLFLLATLFLHRYAVKGGRVNLLVCGLCAGLLLLTKYELILAGIAALAVQASLLFFRRQDPRPSTGARLAVLLFFLTGLIIPPALTFAILTSYLPGAEAFRAIAGAFPLLTHKTLYDISFYRQGMGFDTPGKNLMLMLKAVSCYLPLAIPLVVSLLMKRRRAPWPVLIAVFIVVALIAELLPLDDWTQIGRPLPLFMVILIIIAAVDLYRNGLSPARILHLSTIAFALVLLAKMILNAHVYHYGFVLALPASLVLVAALVDWIPGVIARRGGDANIFLAAALAVIGVTVAVHVRVTHNYMADKVFPVGYGEDTILSSPARGRATESAVAAIDRITPRDATVAVVPEGAMINYLARRRNPTPYLAYLPSDLALHGEQQIAASFATHPPDFIVVFVKNQVEYGEGTFGRGYARQFGTWIIKNYTPVMQPNTAVNILTRHANVPNSR